MSQQQQLSEHAMLWLGAEESRMDKMTEAIRQFHGVQTTEEQPPSQPQPQQPQQPPTP